MEKQSLLFEFSRTITEWKELIEMKQTETEWKELCIKAVFLHTTLMYIILDSKSQIYYIISYEKSSSGLQTVCLNSIPGVPNFFKVMIILFL